MQWIDTPRGKGRRDRSAAGMSPTTLPVLDKDYRDLLKLWVRKDTVRRSRKTLLQEMRDISIECADLLCDKLLEQGWLIRHEQFSGGVWQWYAITWRDLPHLQNLLDIAGATKRKQERQQLLDAATAWLALRHEIVDTQVLDPDFMDELDSALSALKQDKSLRLDLLASRYALMRSIADWHDAGKQGLRRNFALDARNDTKGLSAAEWHWLESVFDLERLGIERFALVAWIAGDITLSWGEKIIEVAPVHFLALPLHDMQRLDTVRIPQRWWLIENRASFEKQASSLPTGVGLIWMPGRPPREWMSAVSHLLRCAPAPAWISADADPSGVDIACSVGRLWEMQELSWEPYMMDVVHWESTKQYWPLNDHDRRLLVTLLSRATLPPTLRELCEAMHKDGRKAEQEAWV